MYEPKSLDVCVFCGAYKSGKCAWYCESNSTLKVKRLAGSARRDAKLSNIARKVKAQS